MPIAIPALEVGVLSSRYGVVVTILVAVGILMISAAVVVAVSSRRPSFVMDLPPALLVAVALFAIVSTLVVLVQGDAGNRS
jgi:hypothetical protein